jgi:hypothetical protein
MSTYAKIKRGSHVDQMSMFPYPNEVKKLGWMLKCDEDQDESGMEEMSTNLLNGEVATITEHRSHTIGGDYTSLAWVLQYRHYTFQFNERPDAIQAAEVLNTALIRRDLP